MSNSARYELLLRLVPLVARGFLVVDFVPDAVRPTFSEPFKSEALNPCSTHKALTVSKSCFLVCSRYSLRFASVSFLCASSAASNSLCLASIAAKASLGSVELLIVFSPKV